MKLKKVLAVMLAALWKTDLVQFFFPEEEGAMEDGNFQTNKLK